jgi:hypothetical protein
VGKHQFVYEDDLFLEGQLQKSEKHELRQEERLKGASRGGLARAKKLSDTERSAIARKGGLARQGKL